MTDKYRISSEALYGINVHTKYTQLADDKENVEYIYFEQTVEYYDGYVTIHYDDDFELENGKFVKNKYTGFNNIDTFFELDGNQIIDEDLTINAGKKDCEPIKLKPTNLQGITEEQALKILNDKDKSKGFSMESICEFEKPIRVERITAKSKPYTPLVEGK